MEFHWELFWEGLKSPAFLYGAFVTIGLATASHLVGIVLGTGLALGSMSKSGITRGSVAIYLWLFRGIPMLLLLLFVWNALPQIFPILKEEWFTPFLAALLALSLHEAAYQAEINRSALEHVDPGQRQAGMALGMSRIHIFGLITLPQAMRVAIPPTVNEYISLLKLTALASVVSLQELLTVTAQAVSASFRFAEYYSVALVYYLVMVSILMMIQKKVEARLDPSRKDRSWQSRRSAAQDSHLPSTSTVR